MMIKNNDLMGYKPAKEIGEKARPQRAKTPEPQKQDFLSDGTRKMA